MKLTYAALLGSMLVFTACDGVEESTTRVERTDTTVVPVPVEGAAESSTSSSSSSSTMPDRSSSSSSSTMPERSTQSGAQSSQSSQGINPSNLPRVPPSSEEINVTVEQPPQNDVTVNPPETENNVTVEQPEPEQRDQ